jgi:hypothetical protein
MNRRSLERRLAVLAKDRRFQPPPSPSPEDLLLEQKIPELLDQMNPAYGNRVKEEMRSRPLREYSDFALAVLKIAMEHVTENRPLAFPDVVAEVYLRDEHAHAGVECRSCRYRLPLLHFSQCPLCGGEVGY